MLAGVRIRQRKRDGVKTVAGGRIHRYIDVGRQYLVVRFAGGRDCSANSEA